MYDIVIGRSEEDKRRLGLRGTVFIGKHYVQMGRTTSLSNDMYLDASSSHVVFVCGKRGGGKSYTMGVVAEGMADLPPEIKQNISVIMLDTMGVYWTMKFPNKRDEKILDQWKLKGKPLNCTIYTPFGFFREYKEQGIPTDIPFSINPADLDPGDWHMTFELQANDPIAVLVERIINDLKDRGKAYTMEDIIKAVREDKRADPQVRDAVENRFENAMKWGLFSEKGTPIEELAVGGQVTVLDCSCYATMAEGWKIKALVIGLVAQKLFLNRMLARKYEELDEVRARTNFMIDEQKMKKKEPLVWLIVDEAHEFLPNDETTVASFPLITILREGRQPGISLILASQQPGKIHTDVMTQADTVICHRITAKMDIEALGKLMQSYMREGLDVAIDNLPRAKGSALIFDDNNEKLYQMKIRPRFTWHGGQSPSAIEEEHRIFEF
ncbi:ATP-binding protein [Candidatus Woesearchaeota archaeon]|nr:ATP-binding protein [Candidatus Woesearchaeota archaeon]